jgi:ankyrin repeat protein
VQGNLESVRLLVEAGADINPQDKDGDFPLSLAAGTPSLPLAAAAAAANLTMLFGQGTIIRT